MSATLSGVAQTRIDAVLLAAGALEVADQESDEIGGHLGRGEEHECMLATEPGPDRIARDGTIRNRGVAGVDRELHVEGGLEGRLVEAGEGAARVGGFELRDGVVALRGLRKIEAAQLVVEDTREVECDRVALPAGMVLAK